MIGVDGRYPDGRAFTEAEPNYAALLDGLLRPDDYLPPWPRWWGSLVSGLVVDEMARHLVFDEAPPIPRSWFDQACQVPSLPDTVNKAFLAFGPAYVESRDQARADGWYTLTLTGDHLHQVVAPDAVAAHVGGYGCLHDGRVGGTRCRHRLTDRNLQLRRRPLWWLSARPRRARRASDWRWPNGRPVRRSFRPTPWRSISG